MTTQIIHGDCRSVLATMPAESVQCCVTSPPYFGLRDYGTASWEGGDPDCGHILARSSSASTLGFKSGSPTMTAETIARQASERSQQHRGSCPACGAIRVDQQIGLEPSPQEYVDELVAVFREVRRVLRNDGTLWLNLGDSYANDGKWGGSSGGKHVTALHGDTSIGRGKKSTGLKPKDLMMIPARVALALQADGWWIRSEIIWSKAAPMPESVRDRPTCAHEKVWLLTKAANYYYDSDAVAEEATPQKRTGKVGYEVPKHAGLPRFQRAAGMRTSTLNAASGDKKNLRNVWHLNPEPFPGAHFATMPATLAERCIKAGTSERGQCPECGAPWVRQTTVMRDSRDFARKQDLRQTNGSSNRTIDGVVPSFRSPTYETLGWQPSCSCPEHMPVPQTVLDPFAGAGTTLLVADRLQRHGIGIELNQEYAVLAEDRLYGDAPLFAEFAA